MKAVFIERHGGPEVLQHGDLPDPTPEPGEVVVDIFAASINGADWKVRAGDSHRQSQFPYILGRDFSGVVGVIGEGVQDLRVGDAVFGVLDTVGGDVAQRSFAVLRTGGRAAFIASGPQAPTPDRDDVKSLRPPVGRARRHLDRIVELFAARAVRAPEIALYRLSEARAAHQVSQSRHFRGKLVFQIR